MQIADFLEAESEAILDESVAYARTIRPLKDQEDSVLRDHLPKILKAISADLRRDQSRKEGIDKSHGKGLPNSGTDGSAAGNHGRKRALSGLRIEHVVAEYRALRSCVLRLWSDVAPATPDSLRDVGRFNEAVDQALAESVRVYSMEVDRWQQIYLGVLGHDLRGPLNAIALTAEIFAKISQDLRQPTETLLRSTRRMTSLIDSLLEYNRANLAGGMAIRRLPIDLAAACHEEIEIQRAALPDTEIVFETLGGNHGEFDESRIREAVANLISNAVRHGVPGEPVTVRLAGENRQVRLTVENASVKDIPADELEQLFDPLRGTLPHRSGKERSHIGLGLFVVRQIVKVHGGEVTGKSAGKRVTLTITLPRFTVEPFPLFPL